MEGRDRCESTPVYVRSFLLLIVLKCGVATEKVKTRENQRFGNFLEKIHSDFPFLDFCRSGDIRKACCGGCVATVVVVDRACYSVIVHTLASMFLLGRHPILVRA